MRLPGAPHPAKGRTESDPPPGGYLFLTCCNLLAGSLLFTHLGFLHITAKIHFHAHWLNVVLATQRSPAVFFHRKEQTQGQLLTLAINSGLQGRPPNASLLSSSQCLLRVCYKTVFISILMASPTPDPNLPVAPCQWPLAATGWIGAIFITRSP